MLQAKLLRQQPKVDLEWDPPQKEKERKEKRREGKGREGRIYTHIIFLVSLVFLLFQMNGRKYLFSYLRNQELVQILPGFADSLLDNSKQLRFIKKGKVSFQYCRFHCHHLKVFCYQICHRQVSQFITTGLMLGQKLGGPSPRDLGMDKLLCFSILRVKTLYWPF